MVLLLSAVALLLLLIIALLAVPISLHLDTIWEREFKGRISFSWLFGLVQINLSLPAAKSPPNNETEAPARPQTRRDRPHPSRHFSLPKLLRQGTLHAPLLRLFRKLWRAIKKSDLYLHLRIGLDDPARTGELWALLGPLSGMLYAMEDVRMEIVPDFLTPGMALQSRGTIRLIPLQLILLVLRFLLSPTFWRAMKQSRYSRTSKMVQPSHSP